MAEAKQEDESERPIEIFKGSKEELESLTGKTYEAIIKKGHLVRINSNIPNPQGAEYSYGILRAIEELEKKTRKIGADALVDVEYFPVDQHRGNNVFAMGYAVKRKPTPPHP